MIVDLEKQSEFLKIELSEVFHFDRMIEFIKELGKEKAEKFLIDGTKLENTDLSYRERYDIGKTGVNHLDISAKYVVIWPVRDINYFAISVMRLQGFNIKVFPSMPLAKKWLLV